MRIGFAAAAICLAAAACGLFPSGIEMTGMRRIVPADDGFPLITYRLFEKSREVEVAAPRALLFYVQGSEDTTVLSAVESLAGATAAGIPVVLMERRGVDGETSVDQEVARASCGKGRRVSDHLRVLDSWLADTPAGTPVIVLGTSEGGDVAAAMAARDPRIGYLVLLGTGGGWTQEAEIRHLIAARGEYLGLRGPGDFDRVLAGIRAAPDSLTIFAGHPYRRWSSFLFSAPREDLVPLSIPIFLAHGVADESVPVESARALRDEFARLGKRNLTYREVAGAGHSFRDASGASHAPRIEVELLSWFASLGLVSEEEAAGLRDRVRRRHPELFPGE